MTRRERIALLMLYAGGAIMTGWTIAYLITR